MPKATLKEGDIIQAIRKAFPEGTVVRFNPGPMSPRGISDILITWEGREFFCEIKVNDTKLTRLQANFLAKRSNPILLQIDTRKFTMVLEVKGTGTSYIFVARIIQTALRDLTNWLYSIQIKQAIRY